MDADSRREGARYRSARQALFVAFTMIVAALASSATAMSPSAFPESSLRVALGGGNGAAVSLGASYVVPARFLDVQVGADMELRSMGVSSARFDATALVFPTVGTTPPISVGVAGDLTWRPSRTSAHLGVVAGLDLLYVSRNLPAVVDVYVAPGWAFGEGFSLAWQVEGRWYEDRFAWLMGSSDRLPLFIGIEVAF